MSDKANMTPNWYIVALAYAAGEPVHNPAGLGNIVQKTMAALVGTPAKMYAMAKGRVGNTRSFSPDNFVAALGASESTSLTMFGLKESSADVDLRLCLRHNPAIEMKYQPPGVLYFIAECEHPALAPKKIQEAAGEFLRVCSAELSVLHGGIGAFPNRDQALTEASL